MKFRWIIPALRLATVFIAIAVCIAGAVIARLRTVPHLDDPLSLHDALWKHISALRETDYPRAFRAASSASTEGWDPVSFFHACKTECPEAVHAVRVELGETDVKARNGHVVVYFIMGDGDVVRRVYRLKREYDGWKIDGLQEFGRSTRLQGLSL